MFEKESWKLNVSISLQLVCPEYSWQDVSLGHLVYAIPWWSLIDWFQSRLFTRFACVNLHPLAVHSVSFYSQPKPVICAEVLVRISWSQPFFSQRNMW